MQMALSSSGCLLFAVCCLLGGNDDRYREAASDRIGGLNAATVQSHRSLRASVSAMDRFDLEPQRLEIFGHQLAKGHVVIDNEYLIHRRCRTGIPACPFFNERLESLYY